jgi:hypothetical protein
MRTLPPRHLGMSRCLLVCDMAQHVDARVALPFQHRVLLNAVASADEVAVVLPHLCQRQMLAVLDLLVNDATAAVPPCVAQLQSLVCMRLCLRGHGITFGKAQLMAIGCLSLLRRLELDATRHWAPDFGDSELTQLLSKWQRLEDFAWRIPCGLSAAALVAAAE